MAYCIARFCNAFPAEFRNGAISWQLFWLLFAQVPSIEAVGRMNATSAMNYSNGLVFGDDKASKVIKDAIKHDIDLANGTTV